MLNAASTARPSWMWVDKVHGFTLLFALPGHVKPARGKCILVTVYEDDDVSDLGDHGPDSDGDFSGVRVAAFKDGEELALYPVRTHTSSGYMVPLSELRFRLALLRAAIALR